MFVKILTLAKRYVAWAELPLAIYRFVNRHDATMRTYTDKQVWVNSKKDVHRPDGPAVIHDNGNVEWWWMGIEMSLDQWLGFVKNKKIKAYMLLKYKEGD